MIQTLQNYISAVNMWNTDPQKIQADYIAKAEKDKRNAIVRIHKDYAHPEKNIHKTPLAGAVILIKDNILTKWYVSSCWSKMLEQYVAPYSATCFTKLEQAGWFLLWKANMDEFAMWWSNETSYFGVVKNPHDSERISWWSSWWSAAAVAADLCLAALGTDTGWSVRQPAAMCGVVWLKPTYGRISRYWVVAMASSLDQVGTLTKTVDDAGILLDAIKWYDSKDATSDLKADGDIDKNLPTKGMKVALPTQFLTDALDPAIREKLDEAIVELKEKGIQVDEVAIPLLSYVVPMYYTIMSAEVSTNLSRFDGIRFGHQDDTMNYDSIQDYYNAIRSEWFGDEVKRRILLGTYVLSSANYEWFYNKAKKVQSQLRQEFNKLFEDYDAILSPTSPEAAWKFGQKSDPLSMYLADLYTIPANLTGIPAISVPYGTVNKDGKELPVGIQFMTNHWREDIILSLWKTIEKI